MCFVRLLDTDVLAYYDHLKHSCPTDGAEMKIWIEIKGPTFIEQWT